MKSNCAFLFFFFFSINLYSQQSYKSVSYELLEGWTSSVSADQIDFYEKDIDKNLFCTMSLSQDKPSSKDAMQEFSNAWSKNIFSKVKCELPSQNDLKIAKTDQGSTVYGTSTYIYMGQECVATLYLFLTPESQVSLGILHNSVTYSSQINEFISNIRIGRKGTDDSIQPIPKEKSGADDSIKPKTRGKSGADDSIKPRSKGKLGN